MKTRALSLDALRGYAIITMILSGQILLTHLPAWMAHAQVPPGKGFDPSIYGITWVDLVFPYLFLSGFLPRMYFELQTNDFFYLLWGLHFHSR